MPQFDPTQVTFVPLTASNIASTLEMVIDAMESNPQHLAVFGADPAARRQRLQQVFGLMGDNPALREHSLVAMYDGRVIGIVGLMKPGECQPPIGQKLRMIPKVLGIGLGPARKVMTWMGTWAKHDIAEPHWHVGPVAVAPDLQGQGLGSLLMTEALRTVDDLSGIAYLETDKEINVAFYRKFGFEVIAEDTVVGTQNWFMRRPSVAEALQTAA